MKPIISDLVTRYESGRLSRRDLVQGLTMLVAAAGASAAGAAQESSLKATGIDHISILVSDLKRSTEFYQSLFGLTVLSEDKAHDIVRLGTKRVIVSLRPGTPHGTIDHFGVAVENFNKDAVTSLLQRRGLTPQENWEYGYFIKDPDGTVVQML
jgi:hypothetical protein